MGALDQLESFLQELLERPAWLLSARRLQPAQLAGAISRELEEHAVRLPDRIVVPYEYVVSLAREDFAQLRPFAVDLETQLADYVERLAAERELSLPGDPQVRIRADPELRPGHVVARASLPALKRSGTRLAALRRATQPAPIAGARPRGPTLTLLGQQGEALRSFALEGTTVTIGRRSDNHIALTDLTLSGYHAQLTATGADWYVTDRGSTNGTAVNGEPVSGRRKLNSGDILEVGLQRLRFQREAGAALGAAVE